MSERPDLDALARAAAQEARENNAREFARYNVVFALVASTFSWSTPWAWSTDMLVVFATVVAAAVVAARDSK